MHKPYREISNGLLRGTPFDEVATSPNQLRWTPFRFRKRPTDFIDGLITMAGNGDAAAHSGIAIHLYSGNRSMQDRFFYDADGELLIVPQSGALLFHTEFGRMRGCTR